MSAVLNGQPTMGIPVLTYHSMAIEGNGYHENDHIALRDDLETIRSEGFSIRPLHEIVAEWLKDPSSVNGSQVVALTCDDGADFDYLDLPHPVAGTQRGFLNILKDHSEKTGSNSAHITSFTIVSPEAREVLDARCMIGKRWWNDSWWRAANASGLMGVGNHSWDHNHDSLDGPMLGAARGSFKTIDSLSLADYQIAQASEFLWQHAPSPSAALFAYPYGHTNEYLVSEYFPRNADRLHVTAAFNTEPMPLTPEADRWAIPRFVFRRDWKQPGDLRQLLRAHR